MIYIKYIIAMIVLFPLWLAQDFYAQQGSPIEKNWYHTYIINSSPDGSWVHYINHSLDGSSTGHVKNIKTSKTFSFSEGNWGKFSPNSKWFTMPINSNSLVLTNLEKGTRKNIDSIRVHHFSPTGKYLITQFKNDSLTINALDKKKVYGAVGNKLFELNPHKDVMVMVTKSNDGEILELFDFDTFTSFIIMKGKNLSFQRLDWSENGKKLGFVYSTDNGNTFKIGVFDAITSTTQFLDWNSFSQESLAISNSQISVSNSGEKIYFSVIPEQVAPKDNQDTEVWDTFDKIIYSRKNFVNSGKQGPWQNVWLPAENRVVALGNTETPHTLINIESDFALVFDSYALEPQFSYDTFVDLYQINIKSGKKELVLSNQFTASNYTHWSPNGNSLAYFKDRQWWLYNMQDRKHINLTINIPHPVYKTTTSPDLFIPYGLAGWAKDGKSIYLYDEFDVWKLSLDGKQKERITTGRESKINFRLVFGKNDERTNYGDLGFNTYSFDAREGLLFSAKNRNTLEMGYFIMKNKKLELITWKNKRLSDLIQMDGDDFLILQQSFTEPISIECINLQTKESKTIFKSNPEWDQFKWPKRKLIYYDTEIADSLKGVLIYPINYQKNKKYPMVVSTYTAQSFLYHKFSPPYIYNDIGFNYLNYALDEYFVLLPDIHYKPNAPGISAALCIESAVKTALNIASIDETKIGLIGHSHGGYDTGFTITHTDIFAAAVAGSGIFNMESFYFDLYKLAGLPEISRIENDNFHMRSSFFENSEAYRTNSPLHQAANIETPLLIWSGKEDTNVNPNQSLQMYFALRRLRKPAKLIYYEEENHVLNKIENKKDLTKRIKEWFDEYLK